MGKLVCCKDGDGAISFDRMEDNNGGDDATEDRACDITESG